MKFHSARKAFNKEKVLVVVKFSVHFGPSRRFVDSSTSEPQLPQPDVAGECSWCQGLKLAGLHSILQDIGNRISNKIR